MFFDKSGIEIEIKIEITWSKKKYIFMTVLVIRDDCVEWGCIFATDASNWGR